MDDIDQIADMMDDSDDEFEDEFIATANLLMNTYEMSNHDKDILLDFLIEYDIGMDGLVPGAEVISGVPVKSGTKVVGYKGLNRPTEIHLKICGLCASAPDAEFIASRDYKFTYKVEATAGEEVRGDWYMIYDNKRGCHLVPPSAGSISHCANEERGGENGMYIILVPCIWEIIMQE